MQYRVTILETPDSTKYLVDKVVESKQSLQAVINRHVRKYPDAYEISATKQTEKQKV